jgi:hypothetical protein
LYKKARPSVIGYTGSKRFSRNVEDFTCGACKAKVKGTGYTDHCLNCLWSKHVDINPGDRKSECMGLMKPIKTEHNRNGFVIIYVCERCRARKKVNANADDNRELLFALLNASAA